MLHALILAVAALVAPAQDARPADRARANLGSYFSTDDYPAGALRRGAEGTVRFELEIGTDGRVAKCNVTASSGDVDLDATTCALLSSRATYSPARDGQGRATVGSDRGSVTWRLPDDGGDGSRLPPFEPTQLASTMRRATAGTISCSFAHNGRRTQVVGPNQCAFFHGYGAEEALQGLGTDAELTLTLTILPTGTNLPDMLESQGDVVFDTRGSVEVAADGSISSCLVIDTQATRRLPGLRGIPNLCAYYGMVGRPTFQSDPQAEVRRGELRIALHLRTGVTVR